MLCSSDKVRRTGPLQSRTFSPHLWDLDLEMDILIWRQHVENPHHGGGLHFLHPAGSAVGWSRSGFSRFFTSRLPLRHLRGSCQRGCRPVQVSLRSSGRIFTSTRPAGAVLVHPGLPEEQEGGLTSDCSPRSPPQGAL